jgi:hypothetical protein
VGVARNFLVGSLAKKHRQLRGEECRDQFLPIEQLLGGHVDPHHQLEPEDCLAQGTPNGSVDQLGPLAPHGRSGAMGRLPGQTIKRSNRWVLGKQGVHVGHKVPKGVGFGEPTQDELRQGWCRSATLTRQFKRTTPKRYHRASRHSE